MKPDAYPIPLLWDMVQQAAHHRWYICLDINWGFWSLPLHPDSRQYTAIITPRHGLLEFTVVPVGIRNSPPEFQRFMDSVLERLKNVAVYIDDIIIAADSFSEAIQGLTGVLERLQEWGLFIKLSKTELFKEEVKLLEHLISFKGICPNPKKVQAV